MSLKMVLEEDIRLLFDKENIKIRNEEELQKCVAVCNNYSFEVNEFMHLWKIFCKEDSKSLYPLAERVEEFQDNLGKKIENYAIEKRKGILIKMAQESATNAEYSKCDESEMELQDVDILEMYGFAPPLTSKNKRLRSPDGAAQTNEKQKIRAVENSLSSSTSIPIPVTTGQQPDSHVSCKILVKFGAEISSPMIRNDEIMQVRVINNSSVPTNVKYMFDIFEKKGPTLTNLYREMGERLMRLWSKAKKCDMHTTVNLDVPNTLPHTSYGMIICNPGTKAVMLESCTKPQLIKEMPAVLLDLSGIKQFSLYAGQVVAVEGKTDSAGVVLHVSDIFTKGYAKKSLPPKLASNLNIMVASGPFTTHDNVDYQPLWNLMRRVKEQQPDVVILIGPFVEFSHSVFKTAPPKYTYQEFFETLVKKIIEQVKGSVIQVILVPSNRDAHHDPVYPTPPFTLPNSLCIPNIHLVSDPCIVTIEGLNIGITSVDSLRHLSGANISNMASSDRLGRLADHILAQSSFYPLNPPPDELNVDSQLYEQYGVFVVQPHIMILPSDMQSFCKEVNEALVLNPQRLHKHIYATLYVRPAVCKEWSVAKNVSCEIFKF